MRALVLKHTLVMLCFNAAVMVLPCPTSCRCGQCRHLDGASCSNQFKCSARPGSWHAPNAVAKIFTLQWCSGLNACVSAWNIAWLNSHSALSGCLQRAQAGKAIETLKEHPKAWEKVDVVLQHSTSEQSKYVALQVRIPFPVPSYVTR